MRCDEKLSARLMRWLGHWTVNLASSLRAFANDSTPAFGATYAEAQNPAALGPNL